MEDGDVGGRADVDKENKADKKQLLVQFKAQHTLVVAFFLLLLWVRDMSRR